MDKDHPRYHPGREDLPVKDNGKKWNVRTEYQPEYCQILLRLMYDGASYNEVARELQVSINTLTNWAKSFEEFGIAHEAGGDWGQGWWEGQGREYLVCSPDENGRYDKFNTSIYIHTMATRYKISDKVADVNVNIDKDMDTDKAVDLVKRLHKETI